MAFNKASVIAFAAEHGRMMYCSDVPAPKPLCCLSCHEDEDLGYAFLPEVEDGPDNPVGHFCCVIMSYMEENNGV